VVDGYEDPDADDEAERLTKVIGVMIANLSAHKQRQRASDPGALTAGSSVSNNRSALPL
jgi:hypothetical protein